GLSLKNLEPRVWDPTSPFFIRQLQAVMVSYGEFHQLPNQMEAAMNSGVHGFLRTPNFIDVYLDNGAFYFLRVGGEGEREAYQEFVEEAEPNWYPVAFDVIPTPQMSKTRQRQCYNCTMEANHAFQH